MEVVRSALGFLPRTALVAGGRSYRYADLLTSALAACRQLDGDTHPPPPAAIGCSGGPALAAAAEAVARSAAAAADKSPRVALMCDPDASYVSGTFAAWLHRGIVVPMCLTHPDRELQYVLEDAEVSSVLASQQHAERMYQLAKPFGAQVHVVEAQQAQQEGQAPTASLSQQQEAELRQEVEQRLEGQQGGDGALIIYTSGTTGRPKGALHTHASLAAQVDTLCQAWEWEPDDRILHALPLHHVHGIVNALLCPLRSGACAEMLPKFSPGTVWQRLQRPEQPVSVFMGVPTMYSHLLSRYDDMAPAQQQQAAAAAQRLRLTVSGSAACPLPIMNRWEQLSGRKLLERYGMTETGMLLGNPYRGERRPGSVGLPFPGVQVRLCNPDGSDAGAGPGELCVRSPQLFREYWRRGQATAEAFDDQGYFLTGDTGLVEEGGYYRLMGRTSVDVIKHGGYKISALHIESVLLEHPCIAEVAVLGLPDQTYGERIAAVVALKQQAAPSSAESSGGSSSSSSVSSNSGSSNSGGALTLAELWGWAADRLPAYQLPAELQLVGAIPRNAMGKVNKKELRRQLFPAPAS